MEDSDEPPPPGTNADVENDDHKIEEKDGEKTEMDQEEMEDEAEEGEEVEEGEEEVWMLVQHTCVLYIVCIIRCMCVFCVCY